MKIVVTGTSGFLGAVVVRRAAAAGHEPRVWRRPYEAYTIPNGVEAVIHCAWDTFERENSRAQRTAAFHAEKALRAATKSGVRRWVGVGSQAEILAETEYGRMKRHAQQQTMNLAMDSGISWAWVRFWSIYGPGQTRGVLARLRDSKVPLKLDGCDQPWNFLHVDDAADVLVALATTTAPGVFDVVGRETERLRSILNFAAETWHRPFPRYGRWHGVSLPPAAPDRLRRFVDWEQRVPLFRGIKEMVTE